MRRVYTILVVAAVVALPAGCRIVPAFRPPPPTEVLPSTDRHLTQPDTTALPDVTPAAAVAPVETHSYYQLTAEECRELACRNSAVANLLESSVTVKKGLNAGLSHQQSAEWVRVVVASYLGQEARNKTAGAALTLYYKLLESELQSDLMRSSIDEISSLIEANDKLAARGFKQTTDSYDLQKQRIELLADQARLRAGIQNLNAELKSLLAIDPATPGFLLPDDLVRVVPDPISADQAIQLGLMIRSDLNLLRSLIAMLNHQTIVAIQKAMVGITPVLHAVQKTTDFLVPGLSPYVSAVARAEATTVRKQLTGMLKDREREAVKEIRSAVDAWTSARDLVLIARKRSEICKDHVIELEKKGKVGMGVELELHKAKLESLKAESELITEICKWKFADVKAREVIGLLHQSACNPE